MKRRDIDQLVTFLEPDRVRPGRAGIRELGLGDLDDLPEFCREHEVLVRPELADGDNSRDDLVF